MPHVDSLLNLATREGANELRIGTDRAPQMFAMGAPRRLSIPKTSADTLRHLLGEILSVEVQARLKSDGRAAVSHEVAGIGTFQVMLTARTEAGDLDVVFLRAGATDTSSNAAPPRPVGAPAPRAVSHSEPPAPGRERRETPLGNGRVLVAPETEPGWEEPSAPRLAQPASVHITDLIRGEDVRLPGPLAQLLERAAALGASDLHLGTGEPPTVRVHGGLSALEEGPCDVARLVEPLLGPASLARLAGGASVDLACTLPLPGAGPGPRLRFNVFRAARGLAASIRLLPIGAPTLDALAFPVPIRDIAQLPNGLVIVSGPTGSGKSTTLAAIVSEALATRSIALVTLEDPIEYTFTRSHRSIVRQRQVGREVKDFATGLRDALREDPDVLLVGEMRDRESISLALTAAETGHLVLTTLHSRSAIAAIDRIVDAYPDASRGPIRVQLADSLRAVVAQRLLPRPRGGRALAAEVLRVTSSVANGIREAKHGVMATAMQSGRKDGMITLERCVADLVKRREISLDVAVAAVNDPETLQSYLAGA